MKSPLKSLVVVWLFTLLLGQTFSQEPPRLVILEPVDITTEKTVARLGDTLRSVFANNSRWSVIPKTEIIAELGKYSKDLSAVCKEIACAFDAANMLQADYVVFSSISLFEDLYIFNLLMVSGKNSQVVWSQVGEVFVKPGRNPDEALVFSLGNLIDELNPANMQAVQVKSKGSLGILDLSTKTEKSKILVERLTAHAYASGNYQVMGQSELGFLMESFGLDSEQFWSYPDSIIPAAKKLGLDYLVTSYLSRPSHNYLMELALFDAKQGEKIRDWPFQAKSFRKILAFENKFVAGLNVSESQRPPNKQNSGARWNRVSLSLGFLTGAVCAGLAIREHLLANKAYDKYNAARTLPELEKRSSLKADVKAGDIRRNIFGATAGLLIGGCFLVWTF